MGSEKSYIVLFEEGLDFEACVSEVEAAGFEVQTLWKMFEMLHGRGDEDVIEAVRNLPSVKGVQENRKVEAFEEEEAP